MGLGFGPWDVGIRNVSFEVRRLGLEGGLGFGIEGLWKV